MGLRELSIIQYQNVSPEADLNRLWLPLSAFEKQAKYLSENMFQMVSIDEAVGFMEKKWDQNKKRPLSLSFDNGFFDFYEHVFPVLSQYNIPATLLINPDKAGKTVEVGGTKKQYLSWDNIKEIANNNITVGAFEDNALNLNHVDQNLLKEHIGRYKKDLEDRLGTEVRYFGVKEGIPQPEIRDLLISTGYRAFLTQCPTNLKPDLFSIGRIQVDDDDFNIFLTKISKTYLFFKDKKTWKYIREYRIDKMGHWLSETFDSLKAGFSKQ